MTESNGLPQSSNFSPMMARLLRSAITIGVGILATPIAAIAADALPHRAPQLTGPAAVPARSFRAIVTQYSRADSCHTNRDGRCLMASGKPVHVGAIACPRFLPLGTQVAISGQHYTCEDRYLERLDGIRAYPTIDVFVEGTARGRVVRDVYVLAREP